MKFFRKVIGEDEEKAFVNLFLEESKLACESIYKLAQLLVLITEGKNVEKLVEEINKLERKVDDVRTKAEGEIYKTAFLPFTRSDRLELLEDIDTLADISEEVAILLRMKKLKITLEKRGMRELANSLTRTADSLYELLETLTKDINDFLNVYQILRERRRDTRGKIYEVYEDLLRSKSISAIDADIVMEVLRKIMVMCRKIGDVGDRARAMVVKYL
jgi:predicted phosphate transport protein (TIGR00153 family)